MQRAKIVLMAADGWENLDIAREVGTDRQTVGRWRTRLAKGASPASRRIGPAAAARPASANP